MKQGFLDPLALMSFKILPREMREMDDKEFAVNPLSSGPFRLDRSRRIGRDAARNVSSSSPIRPTANGQQNATRRAFRRFGFIRVPIRSPTVPPASWMWSSI